MIRSLAGGKVLAAVIFAFSGLWPYLKQTVSLYLWLVPPSVVSVTRRGRIYLWLDALAKYSMMDIFILIITMVGFRVTAER